MDNNLQKNSSGRIILWIISLVCMFVMPIIFFMISGGNGDISSSTARAYELVIFLDFLSYIAAWVLAIISRIKYKNIFSMVLIIIYGSLLVFSIIWFVILIGIFVGLLWLAILRLEDIEVFVNRSLTYFECKQYWVREILIWR